LKVGFVVSSSFDANEHQIVSHHKSFLSVVFEAKAIEFRGSGITLPSRVRAVAAIGGRTSSDGNRSFTIPVKSPRPGCGTHARPGPAKPPGHYLSVRLSGF
jgi:hypothetical protein